MRYKYFTKLTV